MNQGGLMLCWLAVLLMTEWATEHADGCFRVYSGYIKEVDEKPSATSWGPKMTFANLMAEHSNGGGKWLQPICKKLKFRFFLAQSWNGYEQQLAWFWYVCFC